MVNELLVILLVLGIAGLADAANYLWDGGAGDGLWVTPEIQNSDFDESPDEYFCLMGKKYPLVAADGNDRRLAGHLAPTCVKGIPPWLIYCLG